MGRILTCPKVLNKAEMNTGLYELTLTGNFQSICYSFKTLSYSFKMYHSTAPLQLQTIQALFNPHQPVNQTSQGERKFFLHPVFCSTVNNSKKLGFTCFLAGSYLMEGHNENDLMNSLLVHLSVCWETLNRVCLQFLYILSISYTKSFSTYFMTAVNSGFPIACLCRCIHTHTHTQVKFFTCINHVMGFKKTMTELVGNDTLYHKLWLMLQISNMVVTTPGIAIQMKQTMRTLITLGTPMSEPFLCYLLNPLKVRKKTTLHSSF